METRSVLTAITITFIKKPRQLLCTGARGDLVTHAFQAEIVSGQYHQSQHEQQLHRRQWSCYQQQLGHQHYSHRQRTGPLSRYDRALADGLICDTVGKDYPTDHIV